MRNFEGIVSRLFIFTLSVFFIAQATSAQETWKERREERREKFKERIREKLIEKKREATKPTQQILTPEFTPSPGDYEFSLAHDGLTRKYKVHVPPTYDRNNSSPLVIYVHGGAGDMRAAYMDGVDKFSDKHNFILAVPEGTGEVKGGHMRANWNGGSWETGECCGKDVDDVGFISKMIDKIKEQFNIDERMIYATGISNGGLMTNRFGCELSDKIAAIAPVAPAAVMSNCNPSRSISVMDIHGTADPANPPDGGEPRSIFKEGASFGMPYKRMTPYQVVDSWKKINKCSDHKIDGYEKGGAKCVIYNECDGEAEVELCMVKGMGHTYPSGSQYLSAELVGPVSYDISFDQIWEFFQKHPSSSSVSSQTLTRESTKTFVDTCGNGVCEDNETDTTCSKDCCAKIFKISKAYEQECVNRRWNKLTVDADGRPRKVLWKGPDKWEHGAIIALHGGSGSAPVFCFNDIPGAKAAADFGNLAVSQGFAVFSLDSLYNIATDPEGRGIGKRFDLIETTNRKNVDLPYIEKVITETIPRLRPKGSSEAIFITGHSTGAFTAVLAATHFNDKISAFALVSGGDPYGAYLDMGTQEKLGRSCTPGAIRDSETHKGINGPDSCKADTYPNEKEWPKTIKNISFRQFHHQLDYIADISGMYKVREQLIKHGYREDPEGPFVLTLDTDPDYVSSLCLYNDPRRKGRRGVRGEKLVCIEEHYFQKQYSQPILDFFKKHSGVD